MTESAAARRLALQVALTTITFAILDYVWLGVAMRDFYRVELGALARLTPEGLAPIWWAAAGVYAVLVIGLVTFVLPRVVGAPARAAALGGVFGLVTYGTYDLTGYAVIAGWSLRMTLVDIAWGIGICAMTAGVVTALEARLAAAPSRSALR